MFQVQLTSLDFSRSGTGGKVASLIARLGVAQRAGSSSHWPGSGSTSVVFGKLLSRESKGCPWSQ